MKDKEPENDSPPSPSSPLGPSGPFDEDEDEDEDEEGRELETSGVQKALLPLYIIIFLFALFVISIPILIFLAMFRAGLDGP